MLIEFDFVMIKGGVWCFNVWDKDVNYGFEAHFTFDADKDGNIDCDSLHAHKFMHDPHTKESYMLKCELFDIFTYFKLSRSDKPAFNSRKVICDMSDNVIDAEKDAISNIILQTRLQYE